MKMAPSKKHSKNCVCNKPVKDRFEHFMPVLQHISKADPIELKDIIKAASPCLIRLISELGLNILKGTIKLPCRQYKKLRPHKRLLVCLSKPGFSVDKHRNALLKKRGGFLPTILPFILSALSGFAGQALAKSLI